MAKYFKITTSSLLPTRAGIGGKTFLMHQYKNKFMGNRIVSKSFTCRCQPIEYLGYQIHRYSSSEQHIVKDGTCVAMRMSVAESMVAIDELFMHTIVLNVNSDTLMGEVILRSFYISGTVPQKTIEMIQQQLRGDRTGLNGVLPAEIIATLVKSLS